MKARLIFCFLGSLWLGSIAAPAVQKAPVGFRATQFVVGLSPFLDQKVKDDVFRRLVSFLVEEMPVNSSLSLYDAYHLRTIAQVDIPDARAFQSPKTRANQFSGSILKLKTFLAASPPRPEAGRLNLDQAVRFPQFLDFVGDNLVRPEQSTVLLVLGSPLYLDHKEPGFSMVDGYFPSDGHLAATRDQSIFGLKGRGQSLKKVTAHYCYFGDPWVSEVHREKISRFWSLYLAGQGGRLGTFCGDLATAFKAALAAPSDGGGDHRHEIDHSKSKIEMLRITRDMGVADWITRETLPSVRLDPPSITVGPMKIGIRWQGALDLDLYARAYPEAETLYFEKTRSPEGYYFKDHRSSPLREYEFIEFETPVDVWRVEAKVNFYEGRVSAGAKGEVRVEFGGKIYSSPFSIAANHGNQGRSGPAQRDFWTMLDIPAILKLRSDR